MGDVERASTDTKASWLNKVCILAVTAMLCFALFEVGYTIRYWRGRSVWTIDEINKTVRETNQTLDEFRKGVGAWQAASDEQTQAASQVLSSARAAAKQLTSLISATDTSLNSSLIPATVTALNQQNAALLLNQQHLSENLIALQSATVSLRQTLTDADAQISSPQIANSLANIEASTVNLNAGIKNLTGVTADAKSAADYELEQLKKPEKVWVSILKFVLGYGADARGLFVGYK